MVVRLPLEVAAVEPEGLVVQPMAVLAMVEQV
jgi:hypothetical protein